MTQNLEFIHLETPQEMAIAFPLISQLYQNLTFESYFSQIQEMHKINNFKMIAAKIDGEIVAVCGYWILLLLYCDRYIQISSFVVDEKIRGQEIGKKMLQYLENLGRKMNCKKFILDSYTENKKSHSLYFKEGFYIRGFHFMKDL